MAAAIAYLTLLSAPTSIPGASLIDKHYHVIAFAALVLPCAVFYARTLIWIVPSAMCFGIAIEIIQPYVGREAEFADVVADVLGVGLGTAVGLALRRLALRPIPATRKSQARQNRR